MPKACTRCCAKPSATRWVEPAAPAPSSSPCFRGRPGGWFGEIESRVLGAKRAPPSLPLLHGEGPAGDVARLAISLLGASRNDTYGFRTSLR